MFVNLEKVMLRLDIRTFTVSCRPTKRRVKQSMKFCLSTADLRESTLKTAKSSCSPQTKTPSCLLKNNSRPQDLRKCSKTAKTLCSYRRKTENYALAFCTHLDEVITRTYDSETSLVPYFDESGRIALFDGEHVTLYSYDAVSIEKSKNIPRRLLA